LFIAFFSLRSGFLSRDQPPWRLLFADPGLSALLYYQNTEPVSFVANKNQQKPTKMRLCRILFDDGFAHPFLKRLWPRYFPKRLCRILCNRPLAYRARPLPKLIARGSASRYLIRPPLLRAAKPLAHRNFFSVFL
jgi:hypothetical protein